MRITTQMLNETARKAGLPVNNTSLLNYVKMGGNQNSLLNTLREKVNKTEASPADSAKKSSYEMLKQKADKLAESAQALLIEGENNLFDEVKVSGDSQKLYTGIKALFEDYNSTLKALQSDSNTMKAFYGQMLSEAVDKSKESLISLGVTFNKDGTANVDMEKMKAADLTALEEVLGKESDFVKKVEFLSSRISDYAKANAESFSSTYNSTVNLYAIGNRKYNFWG